MVDRARSKTVILFDSQVDFISDMKAKTGKSWSQCLRDIIRFYQKQIK